MMASLAFDETCSALGIPKEIKRSYERKGLKNLYPWQVECLNDTGALQGNNVVYCAPTGGGKTLVAELVLLKTACALRKKCIFVLPYVSLVVEKHHDIQRLLNIYNRSKPKNERVHVKSFHGESKFNRKLQEDILICTIEKANTVVNALIASGQIFQLGCVIIDEMHVIGDASRGYNLEILVSKLKYLQLKANSLSKKLHIQVVALSATISNLPGIAAWFNAVLYQTSFRPVPLQEMIVSGNSVFDSATVSTIRPLLSLTSLNSAISNPIHLKKQLSTLSEEMHQILGLCIEGLQNKQQIIIFCTSRNQCQTTAKLLSELLSHINTSSSGSSDEDNNGADEEILFRKRITTVEKIHVESSGFKSSSESNKFAGESPQNILKKSILNGVAFHHAGLSSVERGVVEKAFRKGILNILTATSTLAAGVNLPAGRVIVRSMYFGRELISTVQYRQMCGRAGRAGLVKFGESFVLTKNNPYEREKARVLSTAPIPKIASQMNPWQDNGKALLKVLLELFALGVCVNEEEIQTYTQQTLMYSESESTEAQPRPTACSSDASAATSVPECVEACTTTSRAHLKSEVQELLAFLSLAKAVEYERLDSEVSSAAGVGVSMSRPHIRVTRFGRAVMESNMNLDEALVIYEDLLQARSQGISLETNLHLLYLVTPLSHALAPNFLQLCQVLDNARKNQKSDILTLFQSLGIGSREEATMSRWTQQPPSYNAVHNAAENLRHLKIERECREESRHVRINKTKGSLSEFECQLICKCKRLWAASALNMLVECQSPAHVANAYCSEGKQLTISDVQSLAHNTSILCFRLMKFCREIGWPDFERLIDHVNTDLLSDGLTEEHQALLGIAGMHPKLAKTLVSNGICSVQDLAMTPASVIVQTIQLDVRFEVADAVLFENKLDELDNGRAASNVNDKADATSTTLSSAAQQVIETPAAMSKDDSRRHHLNSFVHTLIDSARNKLEADEALKAEQALNSLEGLDARPDDSDSDGNSDQNSSDEDDEEEGQERQGGGEFSPNGSTPDDLESSMEEEERCGFMYEQVNWLQEGGVHTPPGPSSTVAAVTTAPVGDAAARSPVARRGVQDTLPASLHSASMYDTTSRTCSPLVTSTHTETSATATAAKQQESVHSEDVHQIVDDGITDDAFMMLFDNLESHGTTSCAPDPTVSGPGSSTATSAAPDSSITSAVAVERTAATTSGTSSSLSLALGTGNELRRAKTPHAHTSLSLPLSSTPAATTQQSPYLFPFTPSKRLSPGRFLYLPQVDEVSLHPNSAQDAITQHMSQQQVTSTQQHQQQESFAWVHMKDSRGCNEFLQQLRGCHCIAFELLYTSIPVAPSLPSRTEKRTKEHGHVSVSSVLKSWSPLIAWRPSSCLLPAKVTSNGFGQHKDPSEAKALTGVSFSFGGNVGYYLPLPTIPPLLAPPPGPASAPCPPQGHAHGNSHSSLRSVLHMDQFAERVQLLICQMVGFESIFGKCPRLRECLRKNMLHSSLKKKSTNGSLPTASSSLCDAPQHTSKKEFSRANPLLAVSKLWATRARHALRLDWLAGKCIEWRLCNEIMTSAQITKVAVDMKGKIFSFRERDVLVRGYLEDPQLAFSFLGTDLQLMEENTTSSKSSSSSDHSKQQQFMLPVPPVVRLPPGIPPTPFNIDVVKTCHVAVATMRIMAKQEAELKAFNLFEAFINIEMPLCVTVADAERNGMPAHSDFITQLRQDIHDRNKMIEYFCQSYNASPSSTAGASHRSITGGGENLNFNFDPNSLKDVHRIKSSISKLLTTQVWEAFDRWQLSQSEKKAGEGVSNSHTHLPPPIPLIKKAPSQWSAGKECNDPSSDSTSSRSVCPEKQDLVTHLVENILASHPLLLLVKEFRSHVRLMPLLQSILNNRFRPYGGDQQGRLHHQELDRVRGVFNTLGTETGRLIVTNPPLQQIPHQCVYTKAERITLFAEMKDAKAQGGQRFQQLIHRFNHAKPASREWVRMTSLASKTGLSANDAGKHTGSGSSSQQTGSTHLSSISNGIYSSVGGSVGNVSQYSSGKLICILDRNITQSIQCAATKQVLNLLEIWQKAGFEYNQEAAVGIPIVVVDIKNQQYYYPADQVVRLLAPLLPSYQEARGLQNASLSLSQSQSRPQSQTQSQSCKDSESADPMFGLLSKQLKGDKIKPEEFVDYWVRHNHMFESASLPAKLEVNPRDGFCASEGYVLMTSDYCQIELRILAHFSLDDNLCDAFRDPLSEDIFKCIASRWQGVPIIDISSEERNRVKQLSYALLYGAGPGKVAADANCSVPQAEAWINQFLSVYPGIKGFMKEVKTSCVKLGYVQTMLGRRRYLPHIRHTQRKERARAERQAVNTVCQGSAADLIKLAMINIHHTLRQQFQGRNYHARRSVPGGGLYTVLDAVRPVLQIHDELVFEVQKEYVHEVAVLIKHCMENAVELNVPLKVKISVGASFGSLELLDLSSSSAVKLSEAISCDISTTHDQVIPPADTNVHISDDTHHLKNDKCTVSGAHNQGRATALLNRVQSIEHPHVLTDTPSSYDTRNRNRRQSGNLQPHPLLAMSAAELLVRTSRKHDREGADDVGAKSLPPGDSRGWESVSDTNDAKGTTTTTSTPAKQQLRGSSSAVGASQEAETEQQEQLPVARCIFHED